MKKVTTFLMMIAFCISANCSFAAVASVTVENGISTETKHISALKMKIAEKFEKKIAKLAEKATKNAPPSILDKSSKFFLLAWLGLWLAGIVLALVSPAIGYVVVAIGSVCFVIWLLKLLKVID